MTFNSSWIDTPIDSTHHRTDPLGRRRVLIGRLVIPLIAWAVMLAGCGDGADDGGDARREVVVFVALDRVYSEPILSTFERETGITVRPVYDTEAAKTTGLINRLLARRDRPEADVLWNNEAVQTQTLAQQGLLEPYVSPQAERIRAEYRDPDGYWTGFAARLRVMIINTDLVDPAEAPASLADFIDPAQRGRGAFALPFYGTTFTHVSILYHTWSPRRLADWLAAIQRNDTAIAPGNGPVRDLVASGEYAFGLTDTDDAYAAILDGRPVDVLVPDADDGAVLIPNTVALVAGGPNPDAGRRLIDFLLSPQVERRLAEGRSAQIPLGRDLADVETPWSDLLASAEMMPLNVDRIAASRDRVIALLREAGLDR